MTTLTLTARNISKNAKTLRPRLFGGSPMRRLPVKSLAICTAAVFLVALVSYILLVNQLTQGTYLIKSGTKQLNTLLQQNANLQAQFAESGLLASVQDKAYAADFQKTGKITYIQLVGNSVASAKP